MKKLATFILLLAVVTLSAQSFQISFGGSQLVGTLDYNIEEPNDDTELVLILTNNSQEVDSIYLTKYVLSEVPGSYNLFCIGSECYESASSTTPLILQPGESSDGHSFHLLYNPSGTEGTTTVKYVFTSGEYCDSVTVNYIYAATGIADANYCVNSMIAYPNPATSNVTVAYDLSGISSVGSGRLVITNLVGSKVLSRPLSGTSGKVNVDLSNLDSGIYFYSIEVGGKLLATRKLIVK